MLTASPSVMRVGFFAQLFIHKLGSLQSQLAQAHILLCALHPGTGLLALKALHTFIAIGVHVGIGVGPAPGAWEDVVHVADHVVDGVQHSQDLRPGCGVGKGALAEPAGHLCLRLASGESADDNAHVGLETPKGSKETHTTARGLHCIKKPPPQRLQHDMVAKALWQAPPSACSAWPHRPHLKNVMESLLQ